MPRTSKTACRVIAVTTLALNIIAFAASRPKLPEAGVVPDEQTAVKIAEAIFQPVSGSAEVERWQPYHAQLDKSGTWDLKFPHPREDERKRLRQVAGPDFVKFRGEW